MTNGLHFGLEYAGASRRSMRARRTAWKALRLLGLSALCGAAWSAGKAAEAVPDAARSAAALEASWLRVALCYLIGSLCVIIVIMLVANAARERKLRRWAENVEAMELGEAYADEVWNPYAGQWPVREPLKNGNSKLESGESWDVGPLESLAEDPKACELVAFLPLPEPDQATVRFMEHLHEAAGLTHSSLSDSKLNAGGAA